MRSPTTWTRNTPNRCLISARIGASIRAHRRNKGVSLSALAVQLGVAPSSLQRWEKGDTHVTGADIAHIAELLGLNPGDLFDPPASQEPQT
jgi:transcriptional regulator with XRE-family HTH domain